jgi:hypothetical protein
MIEQKVLRTVSSLMMLMTLFGCSSKVEKHYQFPTRPDEEKQTLFYVDGKEVMVIEESEKCTPNKCTIDVVPLKKNETGDWTNKFTVDKKKVKSIPLNMNK